MKNGIQLVERIDFLLKLKKQTRNEFCKSINIPPSTIATWKSRNIYPNYYKWKNYHLRILI